MRLHKLKQAALMIAVPSLVLAGCGDEDNGSLSPEELSDRAADIGHDVYWAGEQEGAEIEFEETAEGLAFVHYVEGEETHEEALTIGTYPRDGALAELEQRADQPGTFEQPLSGGGIAVLDKGQATSVYLAFPNVPFQIEVYDPEPVTALRTALSGNVEPVP